MVSDREVLEVLYAARARLENKRTKFDFGNWTTCTCGHIYAAATGGRARSEDRVAATEDERYGAVIQTVARALGWKGEQEGAWANTPASWAACYVSNYTFFDTDCVAGYSKVERREALRVVNEAIARIEAIQEKARLDVLAQARAIEDNADVNVEVVA